MKELDNENATKANAIRDNVYTRHKYIEHDPSRLTTTSMMEKWIDKFANAQQVVAIEFSRTASRTFVKPIVLEI